MTVYCKINKTANDVTGKFTLYYISLFKRNEEDDILINKEPLKKRYSDFLNFKENLELRFKCNIPYFFPAKNTFEVARSPSNIDKKTDFFWFNPVSVLRGHNSTDSEVVNFRKVKLEEFLNDLLSDSFDDKWKKSIITSNFLEISRHFIVEDETTANMFSAGTRLSDAYKVTSSSHNDDKSDQDWWVIFRRLTKLLNDLNEKKEDRDFSLKTLMQGRLLLQKLESNLDHTDKHRDLKKREINFKKIKQELYDFSSTISNRSPSNSSTVNPLFNNNDLPLSNSSTSISSLRAKPGRTLGSKKQIFNDQKAQLQSQEQQLDALHSTIVMQKNLGLTINQELRSQMELMDSLDQDLSDTSRKMNRANNKAKKYNERS